MKKNSFLPTADIQPNAQRINMLEDRENKIRNI